MAITSAERGIVFCKAVTLSRIYGSETSRSTGAPSLTIPNKPALRLGSINKGLASSKREVLLRLYISNDETSPWTLPYGQRLEKDAEIWRREKILGLKMKPWWKTWAQPVSVSKRFERCLDSNVSMFTLRRCQILKGFWVKQRKDNKNQEAET